MKFFNLFKSMQTGFLLLLLISLVASFVDLSNPSAALYFYGFYALVVLFIINLFIYVVHKFITIIKILKSRTTPGRTLYMLLGLHSSLFAVHLGIALVFLGNMMDLSLGYNERVPLCQGETFTLPASETTLKLDDFQIEYYKDGSPSQYTSKVLVNEKGREKSYDITVNHPLEIAGSKIYQESYGWMLQVEVNRGGQAEKYLVKPGNEVGAGESKIRLVQYVPNFIPGKMRVHGIAGNPAVIYHIPGKDMSGAAVLGEKVQIGDNEYLTFTDKQPFTILKIKTSPGMPFVESGGALLAIGIVLVFLFRNNKSIPIKDVASND